MFKATWHSRPGSKPAFGTGLTALNCTQHLVSLQKNGTPQPSRPGLWRVTLQQDRSGKAGVSRQGQTLRGSLAPGKAQRATRFPAGHNFSILEKPLGQVPSAELLPPPGLWPETLTAQNQGRGGLLGRISPTASPGTLASSDHTACVNWGPDCWGRQIETKHFLYHKIIL